MLIDRKNFQVKQNQGAYDSENVKIEFTKQYDISDNFYKVQYSYELLHKELLDGLKGVSPFICACHSVNLDGPYYNSTLNSNLVTLCDNIF